MSELAHTSGRSCGAEQMSSALGCFTATGSVIPVEDQILLGKFRRAGTFKPALIADLRQLPEPNPETYAVASFEAPAPKNVRHNSCFLHDHGLDDGRGVLPVKNLIVDCNYHEVMPRTIQMASTRSLERAAAAISNSEEHEASRKQFWDDRYRRQRGNAQRWADLHDTFEEVRNGKYLSGRQSAGRTRVREGNRVPGQLPSPRKIQSPDATSPRVQKCASAPSSLGSVQASVVPELVTFLGSAGALRRQVPRNQCCPPVLFVPFG